MDRYIVGIDQSTQGTKALLLDSEGRLVKRVDRAHRQIVSGEGWISHDAEEIYRNTVLAVGDLLTKSGIRGEQVAAIGICNQRETTVAWDRTSVRPICDAVVWQCARAKDITDALAARGLGDLVRGRTGIPLSPYFPAAKMRWILDNVPGAAKKAETGDLCMGTVDSWLIYRMTAGKNFLTDWSNASRTQLLNLTTLAWDKEICGAFGIPMRCLAQIADSDSCFGLTTLDGVLETPVPIHGVMGDSQAALFGQGCSGKGMLKATYGTGSSIMMHVGDAPVFSTHGLVTSLAWGVSNRAEYVLEGNINYTGAVISWLKDSVGLIRSSRESGLLAAQANPQDNTYLVPAFSGLGAPYWDSGATATLTGMSRNTGKNEIVKAAEESIAYQIADVIYAMQQDAGMPIASLRVDGGPTKDRYLMQFQSDILGIPVEIAETEELSGIGAAWMAGLSVGLYDSMRLTSGAKRCIYHPLMEKSLREKKYGGWKRAVMRSLASREG